MLRSLELSEADHRSLMSYCREQGVMFLSSPFDETSADMLDDLGVSAFKIPSGELTNHGLLRHLASKNKPLILFHGHGNPGGGGRGSGGDHRGQATGDSTRSTA